MTRQDLIEAFIFEARKKKNKKEQDQQKETGKPDFAAIRKKRFRDSGSALAGAVGLLGAGALQTATTIPALKHISRAASSDHAERTVGNPVEGGSKLRRLLGKPTPPVHVNSPVAVMGGGGAFSYDSMPGYGYGNSGLARRSIHVSKPSPGKRFTPFEAGLLAHEYGHSKNWEKVPQKHVGKVGLLVGGGPQLTATSSLGAAFLPRKYARASAVLGTAAMLPRLADEYLASARAAKHQYKNKGIKGFVGKNAGFTGALGMSMGSYGAYAALPGVTYGIRRALEKRSKFKRLSDTQRSEIRQSDPMNIKQTARDYDISKRNVKKLMREDVIEAIVEKVINELGPATAIPLAYTGARLSNNLKMSVASKVVGAAAKPFGYKVEPRKSILGWNTGGRIVKDTPTQSS